MLGAAGFCGPVPRVREDCDVISVRSRLAMKRLPAQRPGAPGCQLPSWERSAMKHIDKYGHRARDFCRLAFGKRLRLRSSRFPHASLLGERMNGSRKVSKARAASRSQPLRTLVLLSFLRVGSSPAFSAICNRSAVNSSYHSCAHRPRLPGACGRSAAATKHTWAMRSASTQKDLSNSCADCERTVGSMDRRLTTRDATAISRLERMPVSSPLRSRETSLRLFAVDWSAFATGETSNRSCSLDHCPMIAPSFQYNS